MKVLTACLDSRTRSEFLTRRRSSLDSRGYGGVFAVAAALSLFVPQSPADAQRLLRAGVEPGDSVAVTSAARRGPGPVILPVRVDLDLVRSAPARLELPVPGGSVLVAERSGFEDRGDGDAVWYGGVPGAGYDSVVLTVEGDGFAGWFGVPGGAGFRIGAGADGRGRMIDSSWGDRPSDGPAIDPFCGVGAGPEGPGGYRPAGIPGPDPDRGRIRSPSESADGEPLDLMVLYTATAAANWRGRGMRPEAAVRNAVDYLNMVFRNGAMGREARLAHVAEAPAELDRVARDGKGYYDSSLMDRLRWNGDVLRWRREHDADLVHLFTGESPFLLEYAGLADLLLSSNTAENFADQGYGITTNSLVLLNEAAVLAHEIGHNLGAHHEPMNAVGAWRNSVRPYAFGHIDTTRLPQLGTAMSYGGQIEPYFSTLRIRPWGREMGIAGERENERALRETLGLASGFSDALFRPAPGAPAQPGGLSVEVTSDTSLRATWVDNSDNEDRFVVSVGDFWSWTEGWVVPADSEALDLVGLDSGFPYFVWVTARRGDDVSLRSTVVPVVLPGAELPAATGLEAAVEDPRTVRLTWEHPGGFWWHQVRVFRDGEFVRSVTAYENAASIDHLEPGVRYGFRVDAHLLGAATPSDRIDFELPAPDVAAAPTGVEATVTGPNSVRVSWNDESDGEDGFLVQAALARGSGWSGEFLFPAGSRVGEVDGLIPGSRYLFRVAPYAGSLDGVDRDGLAFSAWAGAAPGSLGAGPEAPSDLRFGAGPATLRWRDNSNDELGFEIQFRPFGSEPDRTFLDRLALHAWQRVALVAAGATTFDLGRAASGRVGRYRVFAYNADGFSASSNSVGPGLPGIQGPAQLTAAPTSSGVELAWTGAWTVEGVGRISIEQRSQAAGWSEAATADASAGAARLNRPFGVPYTFRLATTLPDGSRLYSEEVSAMAGTMTGPCRTTPGFLCLRDRFEVQSDWTDPADVGGFGSGHAVPIDLSDESGMFWFFDEDNVELVVKVLDGRALNGNYWVFFGALSDVEYWVTVRDTEGGGQRTYHNRPKEVCGQRDLAAFSGASAEGTAASLPAPPGAPGVHLLPLQAAPGIDLLPLQPAALDPVGVHGNSHPGGGCTPGADRLCLLDGRFSVEVEFVDPNLGADAEPAPGRVLPDLTTRNTGFFWFFVDTNVELVAKILDGRAVNGRYWFLYGGLSDVAYAITVTDTVTGSVATYANEAGSLCGGIDVEALD